MTARRSVHGLLIAGVLLALSACTPGQAQHWRVTASGDVSFASCLQFTVDTLTVSTRVNVGDAFTGTPQQFEITGPEVFFNDGESFSLSSVAAGWSEAETLDMAADWYDLKLEGSHNGRQTLLAYVDRVDLRVDEWVQTPQPGIGVVGCDRV